MSKPLLLISDAVTSPSGLGRITRELAIRIHANLSDVFTLGTLGYGGNTSKKFPWQQYTVNSLQNWQIPELPYVWNDFAGDEKGIVLCVWNASWLPWMSDPSILPEGDLKSFLEAKLFEKWLYFPIDADGPNGKLPESQKKILSGFDRILTYTNWAAGVVDKTFNDPKRPPTEYLPHGTDETVFYPRDRKEARLTFVERVVRRGKGRLSEDVVILGVCATNTCRKDWGLAFEVCGELLRLGVNVGIWAHTDRFQKNGAWDLLMLADEFGMRERVMFTNAHISDEDMSWGYAAMDVTLGIGSGEGWGLPVSESLACGVPCITGDYSGVTDFTPPFLRMPPVGFRYEGYYANRRPVYSASEWADKVMSVLGMGLNRRMSHLSEEFNWSQCWHRWEQWFREK